MSEWTNHIKFTASFKLPIEDAISLVCRGRSCEECPLSDIACSQITEPRVDKDSEMRRLTALARLEHYVHTHYCANAGTEYAETDQFVCSECGLHLQDWTQIIDTDDIEDPTLSEYTFKYCPNCGRKILPYTDID